MEGIKIRAWIPSQKIMVKFDLSACCLGNGAFGKEEYKEAIFMQCFHSRNGIEICEGDILFLDESHPTAEHDRVNISKGIVRFGEYNICDEYNCPMIGFWVEGTWGYYKTFNYPSQTYIESNNMISDIALKDSMISGEAKIIGNIYENFELINESRQ